MCCYEGTTPSAVRLLGSGAAQKNSSGKASTSVGMFPGESVERCGCSWFPRRQPQVVGHSSLCARHGASNGHGTAQETDSMDGCAGSALFPAHYGIHRVAATLHFSEYRLRERGRRSRAPLVAAECHPVAELEYATEHNKCGQFNLTHPRLPGAPYSFLNCSLLRRKGLLANVRKNDCT